MEKEVYGIIFQILNKKNGMTYIGATKNKLYKIRSSYQSPIESDNQKILPILHAIATEGVDNFDWSIVEEVSTKEELSERKKYYIEKNRKAGISYNKKRRPTPEHATKTVAQYSLDGKLIKEYASVKKASEETGILASSIRSCCFNNCSTLKGFVFVYPENFETTSALQKEIERRIDIKRAYDIRLSQPKKNRYIPSKKRKKVAQFSIEGDLIHIYESARVASEVLGINKSSIKSCCNNNSSTLKGHIFIYTSKFKTKEEMKAEALRRSAIWKNYTSHNRKTKKKRPQ